GLVLGIRLSAEGAEEAGLSLDGLCELLPHVCPLVDYVNLTVGVRATYVKDMATDSPPLLGEVERLRPLVDRPLIVSQAFRRGARPRRSSFAGVRAQAAGASRSSGRAPRDSNAQRRWLARAPSPYSTSVTHSAASWPSPPRRRTAPVGAGCSTSTRLGSQPPMT